MKLRIPKWVFGDNAATADSEKLLAQSPVIDEGGAETRDFHKPRPPKRQRAEPPITRVHALAPAPAPVRGVASTVDLRPQNVACTAQGRETGSKKRGGTYITNRSWESGVVVVARTEYASNLVQGQIEKTTDVVKAVMAKRGLEVKTKSRPETDEYYQVDASCAVAMGCPVQYRARIYYGMPPEIEVRQFGSHIHHVGAEAGSATIFAFAEASAAAEYKDKCADADMKIRGLKEAFSWKEVPARADLTDKMMRNWIYRENVKRAKTTPMVSSHAGEFRVEELVTNIEAYAVDNIADIMQSTRPDALCVLPGYSFTKQRGYAAFCCKNMLAPMMAYRARFLLSEVDAKVGKGRNAWRVMSFGFYVKGDLKRTTLTRSAAHRKHSYLAYTTQYRCVLQALVSGERTDTSKLFYDDVIRIIAATRSISQEEAAAFVHEVSKDWNDGLEAGRKLALPSARPYGDPTHMHANLSSVLPKKCRDLLAPGPTWASENSHAAWIQEAFTTICDHCPTADLLDVLLRALHTTVGSVLQERDALAYLYKERYLEEVAAAALSSWRTPTGKAESDKLLFSTAWRGLFSGFPGFKCGSQPAENFHSTWEVVRKSFGGHEDTLSILAKMQRMYQEDNAFTAPWSQSHGLDVVAAERANPDLLTGNALRSAGLSSALAYHVANSDGVANHVIIEESKYTVVAYQNTPSKNPLASGPAQQPVDPDLARAGAKMIFADASQLLPLALESGVVFVTSTKTHALSLTRFRALFEHIAYVIVKPTPAPWERLQNHMCTCLISGLQQQCQHGLHTESLRVQQAHKRRIFDAGPTQKQGRPKGAAKAKRRRIVHD